MTKKTSKNRALKKIGIEFKYQLINSIGDLTEDGFVFYNEETDVWWTDAIVTINRKNSVFFWFLVTLCVSSYCSRKSFRPVRQMLTKMFPTIIKRLK